MAASAAMTKGEMRPAQFPGGRVHLIFLKRQVLSAKIAARFPSHPVMAAEAATHDSSQRALVSGQR